MAVKMAFSVNGKLIFIEIRGHVHWSVLNIN